MRKLFEGVSPPPRPPEGARPGELMRVMSDTHDTTYWLTAKEAGAAGYREVTNLEGVRIVQFGLCRDDRGEWVYPRSRNRTRRWTRCWSGTKRRGRA